MPWFKVDDKLHDHRKARQAGSSAMGLWVLAGSWAADNTMDGFVPESVCSRWDSRFRRLAERLVEVGLWETGELDGEAGWWFHDWKHMQPSKDEVLGKREQARERMARVRANKTSGSQDVRANTEGTSQNVRLTPSRPVPSRPEGSEEPKEIEPRKRATRIPEDWKPTQSDIDWQRSKGISDLLARRSLEKFGNYWSSKSGQAATKTDWSKTWQNWLLTEQERTPTTAASRPGSLSDRYQASTEW